MPPSRWISELLAWTLARYILAGGCAAGVNFLARMVLSEAFRFETAVILAQAIGLLTGFLLYRTFVFANAATTLEQQIIAFGSVNLLAAAVVIAVAIFARLALLEMGFSAAIADPFGHATGLMAGAPVNFCGHLLVTFRRRTAAG